MNRPVRIALLALLATVAACACAAGSISTAVPMRPGAVAVLLPGQSGRLPDATRLEYVRLRMDSRCPENVLCVQAGWAEVDFVVQGRDGSRRAVVLSTQPGAQAVVAAGWAVELVDLGRGPSPVAHVRASRPGR